MITDCFNPKPQPPNCLIKPLEANLKDRKLILQILNNIDNNIYHIQTSGGLINDNKYLCNLVYDNNEIKYSNGTKYNNEIIGDLNFIYNISSLNIDLIFLHEIPNVLNNVVFINEIINLYNNLIVIDETTSNNDNAKKTIEYTVSTSINQDFTNIKSLFERIIKQCQNYPDFINDPIIDNSIIQNFKLIKKIIHDIILKSPLLSNLETAT